MNRARRKLEPEEARLLAKTTANWKGKPMKKKKKAYRPASIPSKWAMEKRISLLKKDNVAEEHIERTLSGCGVLFTREFPLRYNEKDYFMDFAVETENGIVCLEVDGGSHMSEYGRGKDRSREKEIFASGEAISMLRLSWGAALEADKSLIDSINATSLIPGAVVLLYQNKRNHGKSKTRLEGDDLKAWAKRESAVDSNLDDEALMAKYGIRKDEWGCAISPLCSQEYMFDTSLPTVEEAIFRILIDRARNNQPNL